MKIEKMTDEQLEKEIELFSVLDWDATEEASHPTYDNSYLGKLCEEKIKRDKNKTVI